MFLMSRPESLPTPSSDLHEVYGRKVYREPKNMMLAVIYASTLRFWGSGLQLISLCGAA